MNGMVGGGGYGGGLLENLFIHLMSQVEKSVPKPERKRSMTQTKSDWTVKKTREVSN